MNKNWQRRMDAAQWHVRKKGYLKIHVAAVDIKKKRILSLEVTSEEVYDDGKMFVKQTCR
jgi:hypothetical protein